MTQEQIQTLFKQAYNQNSWKQFLGEVFANARLLSTPETLTSINTAVAQQAVKLGYISLNENGINREVAIYEVTLASGVVLERNRVGLRNLLRRYWKDIDAAFIVYHNPNNTKWRFTYVSELTGYDAEGEFIKVKTEPKRYTYVLGEGESTRTAAERFTLLAKKGNNATLDDVKEAFSVEKLSKSFFDEYVKHYELFCEYMVSKPSIRQTIFDGDEKAIRDFTKKLLGRIVFLYFIQKKGWLGVPLGSDWGQGNFNFLTKLFENHKNPDLFYSEILARLFFDTLNTKRTNDEIELVKGQPCRIPFLNGGLFEEDDKKHRNLIFDAQLFRNLFDFFNQYNFTIYEDDPNDHTVAVDPEMLGHIFENLLEDNKDKGAFYTPKEIVHYMCQESLIEYLATWFEEKGYEVISYTGLNKPDQPQIFSVNQGRKGQLLLEVENTAASKQIDRSLIEKLLKKKLDDSDKKLVIKHSKEFEQALKSVKICDPAIGSGAFPMGLLHEIFTAKQTLWQFQHGNLVDFPASEVKLNIIQNSIYGVDIEKGAVDIARLRFWLSLIVDEPEPKALPNLDYKIVVGNSLVSKLDDEIIDIDWSVKGAIQGEMFGNESALARKKILEKISREQKEFFNSESDKHKLAVDIRKLKIDLLVTQFEQMVKAANMEHEPKTVNFKDKKKFAAAMELYLKTLGWKETINKLKTLKGKPEQPLNFFDWKLDFPEVMNESVASKVGFDIVIGNPPYVEAKKLKHIAQFLKNYIVYSGTSDLSSYFFELGNKLCKERGLLCLINTNKFFNTGYGKPVRELIISNEIKQLLNFEQVEVFENILVSSVIISIKRKKPNSKNEFPYKKFYKLKNNEFVITFLEEIQKRESYLQANLTEKEWSFADSSNLSLKLKIETNSLLLKNIRDVRIYRGVTTGFNPAFIINNEKKGEFLEKESKSVEIIKPLLQGRNIRKWTYNQSKEHLLFIPWHFPFHTISEITGNSKRAEEEFENNYPFVYHHLRHFKEELSNRNKEETGIRYEWYALQRCAASYYPEFEKPKIIWGLTADKWAYAYDDKGHYLPSNGYILTSEKTPIKYLLAILNSNILKYYFGFIGVMTAGGAFTLKHSTIQELPIKIASNQTVFTKIVDEILDNKSQGKDTTALEQQIDNLVYRLYNLTYEEVKVVDPEFGLSREEYEGIVLE